MKKLVRVKIKWLLPEEDGRKKIIPVNIQYCPIIIFEDLEPAIDEAGKGIHWSAEIYNTDIGEGNESFANLSYLFENAPTQFLQLGNRFSLYEGLNLVAKGVVISV